MEKSANPNTTSSADTTTARKAKEYEAIHNWLFLAEIILIPVFLLILILPDGTTCLSSRITNWLETWSTTAWLTTTLYGIAFVMAYTLFLLPFKFYSSFVVEHKYHLSNETVLSWFKDMVKSLLINIVITVIFIEVLYFLLRAVPETWWIWTALFWILFVILLAQLTPVLVIPLFYKLKPIDNLGLVDRLTKLAHAVKAKVLGVFEMDLSSKSKKANAALAGLGNTKRIILSDTLLSAYTEDEIEVILAHELGHFYYKHIWKKILVNSIGTLLSLYIAHFAFAFFIQKSGFQNIENLAAFPLFLITIFLFTVLTMPLGNLYSRVLEIQADRFAIATTRKPDAFITSMQKLSRQNLADAEPHPVITFLLHDHPPIAERIRLAESYRDVKYRW